MTLVDLLVATDLLVCLREVFGKECIEVGVIVLELFTGVAPIVFAVGMIHLCVDVKPVLHSLGEIFHVVGDAISAIENATGLGFLVELLEASVKIGFSNHQTNAMDRVSKLMDEDVLSVVFINLITQHILLGA